MDLTGNKDIFFLNLQADYTSTLIPLLKGKFF